MNELKRSLQTFRLDSNQTFFLDSKYAVSTCNFSGIVPFNLFLHTSRKCIAWDVHCTCGTPNCQTQMKAAERIFLSIEATFLQSNIKK